MSDTTKSDPPARPEVWLRGPIPGIPAVLQPVAHALLQARDEVESAMEDFPDERLWIRPEGVASVGFHLQHLAGILDRLFTYARGEALNDAQLETLSREGNGESEPRTCRDLVTKLHQQVDRAIEALRSIDERTLLETRVVGRGKLPSTVLGLLFHAAEHTQRHTGQLLVTVRIQQKSC